MELIVYFRNTLRISSVREQHAMLFCTLLPSANREPFWLMKVFTDGCSKKRTTWNALFYLRVLIGHFYHIIQCLLHKHTEEELFSGFITGIIMPLFSSPESLVCFYYMVPVTHVLLGCVLFVMALVDSEPNLRPTSSGYLERTSWWKDLYADPTHTEFLNLFSLNHLLLISSGVCIVPGCFKSIVA